jgi:hypothetical protein
MPVPSPRIDFSKLPFLDNSGLSYLPTMQYFDVDMVCPLEPMNKIEPHQAVMVILHLPDGSFKCLGIPLDAVYEDKDEYVILNLLDSGLC